MKRFYKRSITKLLSVFLVSFILIISFSQYALSGTALAAENPTAENVTTNLWGSGGQISFDLNGCSGYLTITVVVEFNGEVKSPSGWGFDSYTIKGNQVTAVCSASGQNSWGFDSKVGIQVSGSDVTSAKLISVSGDGDSGSVSDSTASTSATSAASTISWQRYWY